MTRQALAEELKNLRERYHHSTFSLNIFVRESLKAVNERRSQYLQILNTLRGQINDNEIFYLERRDGAHVELTADNLKTTANAVTEVLYIGEPHTRMLLEMGLIYASALFDALVSDILIMAFRHVPETLRSERTLTAEEALRFPSREDLIEELARREIHELTYMNVEDQSKYLRRKFNIDMFGLHSVDVTIADLAAVRERRNLIAHNNGVANSSYVAKYSPSCSIGDPVVGDAESAKSDRELLRKVGFGLIHSFHRKLAPPKVADQEFRVHEPTDP